VKKEGYLAFEGMSVRFKMFFMAVMAVDLQFLLRNKDDLERLIFCPDQLEQVETQLRMVLASLISFRKNHQIIYKEKVGNRRALSCNLDAMQIAMMLFFRGKPR
jgi:hypothetical protein